MIFADGLTISIMESFANSVKQVTVIGSLLDIYYAFLTIEPVDLIVTVRIHDFQDPISAVNPLISPVNSRSVNRRYSPLGFPHGRRRLNLTTSS